MQLLHCVFLALAVSCAVPAQTYTISTVAGGGLPVNIPGTSAFLRTANGVAVDVAGNVFFPEENSVLRLDAITGILSLAAGNGTFGFSGDNGPATSAQLRGPADVAVDSSGNLYIADFGNNRIRKVSDGVITTVAGNGTPGFSGDNGPATSAQLYGPVGVTVDSAGNLYIAEASFLFTAAAGYNRIRKVSGGVITTVAGNGTYGFSGDNGPATSAQLAYPNSVAVDSTGNLYIADAGNNRIRKVSGGVITTVAGTGLRGSSGDNGTATSAQLAYPSSVAVDSTGNLYIADSLNDRIRKVSGGVITTVAGGGRGGDGPATSASLAYPYRVTVDSAGNLYITSSCCFGSWYNLIRKVSNGLIATIAGGGFPSAGNGPATSAQLGYPTGVAVDSAGDLYIADYFSDQVGEFGGRIRKVSGGVITTVAGNGTWGFSGDNGPATSAQFGTPGGVAVDSAGNLFIADSENSRVRKVSGGVITTVAGGGSSLGDNGPATSARLRYPNFVAVDSAGNLFIADNGDNRIRKVSNGVITTVAGNGMAGFSGDNGPATNAQLRSPGGIAVDSAGDLYIADIKDWRIRKVSGGVITTVAGNGTSGFSGDNGPATKAQLGSPGGVAVDSAGNLYISANNRIRKVSDGVITTVAGNGDLVGSSGDNLPATSTQLAGPFGVAVDSAGNVYFGEDFSFRVRVLQPRVFSITGVTNAAGNLPSASISPGEIIVLYGSSLGPSQLAQAGTTVTINGIPAPILYTSASQVAAIVPYGITGAMAQITAAYQGQTTAPFQVPISPSAPGIFTYDSTGKGPAAALNQDGVTVNTAANPAQTGDVISLYATGEGQTTPAGVDGKLAAVPLPTPVLPVAVTIGGQDAEILYAGGAPGAVAGLLQINVRIPSGIPTGAAVPVALRVGNASAQSGVTVSVWSGPKN